MLTFNDIGIDLKGRTSGSFKTICPQCSEQRKHKHDACLSVNIDDKVWNCHNCNWSGSLSEKQYNKEQKEYQVPVFNNAPVSEKTLAWFKSRGISQSTLIRFKVTESQHNGRNWINFNYFRNDALVNVKFRDAQKNFRLSQEAEIIFYNLDGIKDSDYCVITEGEIDTLSVYEACCYPAISVPTGASQPGQRQKLQCLDNCYEHFADKTKIVIATDGDGPGIALREELGRRLGKHRCYYVKYPEGCKDLNDVLVKHGKAMVKELIEEVHPFPVEGVLTASDFNDEIDMIYNYGYPKGDRIGFFNFDNLLSFRRGELTIITGIPNSGKSEFLDEICHRLVLSHQWKFGIYSAENQPPVLHFSKIAERYIGKKLHHGLKEYQMSEEEKEASKDFVSANYFFINLKEGSLSLEALLEKAKELVLRRGITGFVIDPWNYIEHLYPKGVSETQYISQALSQIASAAKMLNIHFFLVAHPTKLMKDKKTGEYEIPTLYNISGSAHFFNKTDNGICVYRRYDPDQVDIYVQKVRFKFIGKLGKATFSYDWINGRYTEQ